MIFSTSGIDTYFWVPTLVSFIFSFFTSMAGISGAFILLPFQMSFFNFTTPSVSSTNLIYNIVSIPLGVFRYIKEKRILWSLIWIMVIGAIPGTIIGVILRLYYLSKQKNFQIFVALILLFIGIQLMYNALKEKKEQKGNKNKFSKKNMKIKNAKITIFKIKYTFQDKNYNCNTISILFLSFLIGIIGSSYGIGGGAIMSPILVSLYKLPVHSIAGSTLLGTFITSFVGIICYQFISFYWGYSITSPDWLLGIFFGLGGICGIYLGAYYQYSFSPKLIKIILSMTLIFIAIHYTTRLFL